MKPFAPVFGLPLGISSTFWFLIGLIRYIAEKINLFRGNDIYSAQSKLKRRNVACIVSAYNEELVIRKCIRFLKASVSAKQIYVISDGSNDKTYRRARMENCHVSKLSPGRGKAKAIIYTLKRYHLFNRYKLIFIVDADTLIDKEFVTRALPLFNDPSVSVVYGSAKIQWPPHIIPRLRFYYVAYRERLNRMLQYFFAYGQTWKYTNVSYVIPGFATIYRSKILRRLPIDTPGLLIEDFNTAFQLHKSKLGKIFYNPKCIGWDQHPETLTDYWKQVKRWNIGFFQTVRHNGFWPSLFWLTLLIFTIEIFVNSIFIVMLPLLILYLLAPWITNQIPLMSVFTNIYQQIGPYQYVTLIALFISFFIIDYGLTVLIGLINKKPQFIIYGLFFVFMHYVTSLILMSSLIPGFFSSSSGRWVSPKRSKEQSSVKL